MKHIIVFIINIYQRIISPFLPKSCRFEPTCSTYCKEAVIKYGTIKGSWLCIKRIIRCHPWNPGGYDPLP